MQHPTPPRASEELTRAVIAGTVSDLRSLSDRVAMTLALCELEAMPPKVLGVLAEIDDLHDKLRALSAPFEPPDIDRAALSDPLLVACPKCLKACGEACEGVGYWSARDVGQDYPPSHLDRILAAELEPA